MNRAPGRPEATAPEGASAELPAAVQEDLYRLEVYKEQLTSLVRQQEMLRVSLESHARAQRTLEELEQFGSDREILLPVGAETFVQAVPRSRDRVLIGLGSGIVAELDRAKALEVLGQRRVELEKADQSLNQQFRRLENEAAQVQARLQAVYQQAQMQQAPEAGPSPRAAPPPSRARLAPSASD